MKDPVLSPEQEAQIASVIKARKPYLIAIEEQVQKVEFGSVLVEVMVRNGSVDKMDFKEVNKSWIREKSS